MTIGGMEPSKIILTACPFVISILSTVSAPIKQFPTKEHRIPRAMQIGRDWIFPEDTHFPADRRKKG